MAYQNIVHATIEYYLKMDIIPLYRREKLKMQHFMLIILMPCIMTMGYNKVNYGNQEHCA